MLVIAHNTAVAVSTVTVAVVLAGQVGAQWTRDVPATTGAQCIIVVSSAVAGVASLGRQMSLKRDWAVSLPDRGEFYSRVCCTYIVLLQLQTFPPRSNTKYIYHCNVYGYNFFFMCFFSSLKRYQVKGPRLLLSYQRHIFIW